MCILSDNELGTLFQRNHLYSEIILLLLEVFLKLIQPSGLPTKIKGYHQQTMNCGFKFEVQLL